VCTAKPNAREIRLSRIRLSARDNESSLCQLVETLPKTCISPSRIMGTTYSVEFIVGEFKALSPEERTKVLDTL
jgi:hypothetical protein